MSSSTNADFFAFLESLLSGGGVRTTGVLCDSAGVSYDNYGTSHSGQRRLVLLTDNIPSTLLLEKEEESSTENQGESSTENQGESSTENQVSFADEFFAAVDPEEKFTYTIENPEEDYSSVEITSEKELRQYERRPRFTFPNVHVYDQEFLDPPNRLYADPRFVKQVKSVTLRDAPVDELFKMGLKLRLIFPNFTKLTIICTEYHVKDLINLCCIFEKKFNKKKFSLNPFLINYRLIFLMLTFHEFESDILEEFTLDWRNCLIEDFAYSKGDQMALARNKKYFERYNYEGWFEFYITKHYFESTLKKLCLKNVFYNYFDYLGALYPNLEEFRFNKSFLKNDRSFKNLRKLNIHLNSPRLCMYFSSNKIFTVLKNIEELKFSSNLNKIAFASPLDRILSQTPKLKSLTLLVSHEQGFNSTTFISQVTKFPEEVIFDNVNVGFIHEILENGFQSNVLVCTINLNPYVYNLYRMYYLDEMMKIWKYSLEKKYPNIKWNLKVFNEDYQIDLFPNFIFGKELLD